MLTWLDERQLEMGQGQGTERRGVSSFENEDLDNNTEDEYWRMPRSKRQASDH